jgi:hypothetical protein
VGGSRVGLILAAGLAVVLGAAAVWWMIRPAPEPPAAVTAPAPVATSAPPPPETPRPAPAVTKPAAVAKPTPEPEPEPTLGTLVIESDVPDTSVFVDRVYLGTAPVTATKLTPGPHRLNLSAPGYEGFLETVEVAAGTRTLAFKFKEIRLDETIEVVHKHALGSCAGTLHATPQGITYTTTNAGDAFSAGLPDLETFEVDYAQKNLRIKVRGKTYNFTVPASGSADPLLSFHQAVEKARARLKSGRRP